MAQPKAVLLDLDDTLLDHIHASETTVERVWEQVEAFRCRPLGEVMELHDRLLEEIHVAVACGRMPLQAAREARWRRMLEACGVEAARAAGMAGQVAAAARATYLGCRRVVPGAMGLLAALRGKTVMGIVTNNTVEEQTEKVRTFGIEPLIDFMVVSEEMGVAKPDPRIFHEALRRARCAAGEAVMLGDAWATDVRGALAAGIRAVWLNRKGVGRPQAEEAVAEVRGLEPVDGVMRALGF